MPRQYLLSIDGGGIRGIIPACALAKLEDATGKLTRDTFSFVAGTSTGAIIAAGIAAGVPAARIRDLYLTRAREVFTTYPWNILKRIVKGSMYSTQKLYDMIAGEVDPTRNKKLNDFDTDLLITAKGFPDGIPWYFVRANPNNSGCTGNLGLVDCATASVAAPAFFDPWTIREDTRTATRLRACRYADRWGCWRDRQPCVPGMRRGVLLYGREVQAGGDDDRFAGHGT